MTTTQTRLAVAELTAMLTTDFDVATLLQSVAGYACDCFDAYSAAVILVSHPEDTQQADIRIVAEAAREGGGVDPSLHVTGPAVSSARDGAVSMIVDLAAATETRWPQYRQRALAAGMRAVRAFPVTTMAVPVGSVVVHTDEPWGALRPNDFGQILADLVAIALSMGHVDGRRNSAAETVEAVLHGTTTISLAVGILAEYFDLDITRARERLIRLARMHDRTLTAQAAAIVAAQRAAPNNLAGIAALHEPPNLAPPRRIDS